MVHKLFFSKTDAQVKDTDIVRYKQIIYDEIDTMKEVIKGEYENERCSLYLPFDTTILNQVTRLVEKKQSLHPEYIIVVGIGGSNLGTIAVQEAVYGSFYNQTDPTIKILYADTVDEDKIHDIITLIEPTLKLGKNILICGISKSGGTTETIANFEVLINVLETYKQNSSEYVVTITDKDSKLWKLSQEKHYDVLSIPKNVGGRYSVFSPVGLFPLAMIGVTIKDLVSGAKDMIQRCLTRDIEDNPAALSALLIYHHYLNNINIHDLFLFSTDFESIGKWYRQLMAESIGKEFDRQKKQVYAGITPTVSIGSVDLHSMAQLYLGGPFDKFTTFLQVQHNNHHVDIPEKSEYEHLVKGIQNRGMQEIMNAIYKGTTKAFQTGKRPYMEITLSDKTEESIGQLLQMKMIEMMFLGALMNVNPYDQPNVESYKVETRKELEK